MKIIFAFLALGLVSFTYSSSLDWKVIAQSGIDCKEDFKILAKQGEKYVIIDNGEEKIELESRLGDKFNESNHQATTYVSTTKSRGMNSKKFTFNQPSMVDGNRAVVEIENGNKKEICKVEMK